MGRHVDTPTREAALAEALARYNASWDELAEYRNRPDVNQQLLSMTSNAIIRQYEEDVDAARKYEWKDHSAWLTTK